MVGFLLQLPPLLMLLLLLPAATVTVVAQETTPVRESVGRPAKATNSPRNCPQNGRRNWRRLGRDGRATAVAVTCVPSAVQQTSSRRSREKIAAQGQGRESKGKTCEASG